MLRTWCQLCHLDYAAFAGQAQQARDWKNPVPPFFGTFRDFELAAHTIFAWQPNIIPGPLQTRGYAMELSLTLGLDESQAKELVEARIDLQRVINKEHPATLWAVMDEYVLYRQFGTRELMRHQLRHLVEQGRRPHIGIQVVPARYSGNAGHVGAFTIASVDGAADALLSGGVEDSMIVQSFAVRRAHAIFDRVRSVALPKIDSLELIARVAEQCEP
jgi:hypothetical protein